MAKPSLSDRPPTSAFSGMRGKGFLAPSGFLRWMFAAMVCSAQRAALNSVSGTISMWLKISLQVSVAGTIQHLSGAPNSGFEPFFAQLWGTPLL